MIQSHKMNVACHYSGAVEVCWLATSMSKPSFGVIDSQGDTLGYGATPDLLALAQPSK